MCTVGVGAASQDGIANQALTTSLIQIYESSCFLPYKLVVAPPHVKIEVSDRIDQLN